MKKIAIIGLALGSLLSGCASHVLDSDAATETEVSIAQSQELETVKSQVKSLRWRVSKLKKRLDGPRQVVHTTDPNAEYGYLEVKQRITDLERAWRQAPRSNASNSTGGSEVDVRRRFADLNKKLDQLAVSQKSAQAQHKKLSDGLDQDRELVTDYLTSLEEKIAKLEKSQGTAGSADTTAADRVAKLEASLKTAVSKHQTLAGELEKDRSLVIDYLEDLNARIGKLEKSSSPNPSKP